MYDPNVETEIKKHQRNNGYTKAPTENKKQYVSEHTKGY